MICLPVPVLPITHCDGLPKVLGTLLQFVVTRLTVASPANLSGGMLGRNIIPSLE